MGATPAERSLQVATTRQFHYARLTGRKNQNQSNYIIIEHYSSTDLQVLLCERVDFTHE